MKLIEISKNRQHRGQFTQTQLLNLMGDIDGQPDWRTDANRCCAYYDGDQIPPQVAAVLEERGQPVECQNLIAPAIDSVLGTEAKTRSDLRVEANYENDDMEKLAEALNAEFYTVCQEMRIDRVRSDAYAGQIKAGLSWVEVRRNPDVTGPRYIAEQINRNEVDWDWLSKKPDLRDARWVRRRRWIDLDEAVMLFPQRAETLKNAVGTWDTFDDIERIDGDDVDLRSGWEERQTWSRNEAEYLSTSRDRIMLYVIYYRVYERIPMLALPTGKMVEYDKNNIAHAVAVASGRVKVEMRLVSFIRESWWAGPYHLGDRPCDAPQGMFPLVPFWGFRKDQSGIPYGLVSRMISAQNSYNFRHLKVTWLLQASQVIMDSDATNMTAEQVRKEANRPDGVFVLNADRKNKTKAADALQINRDSSVSAQQMQVMEYDRQNIQDCAGIYSSYMGQDTSGVVSGIAVSNLVEQSSTTLAEINDNYTMACNALGELVLNYLLEDLKQKTSYTIVVNRKEKRRRKVVTINTPGDDGKITNDISRLDARIVLAPIDSTPAYRAQLADRLIGIIQKLPPQAQSAVIDLVLELVEIPNKDEFIDRVSRALGTQDPQYMTDEEKQASQQQAKLNEFAQALQFKQQIAEIQNKDADTASKQASANKSQASADGQKYSDGLTMAQTGQIMQQMELTQQTITQQGQQIQQLQQLIIQIISRGPEVELQK
ncbi:TPA: portal protein [Citrobacter freundii]|uniref:portal protein n=1 Tax=Citrobacter TaxID=544 RepID=UPI00155E6297|nr:MULTISPECIES: portal protein [Citrobacter]EKU2180275.1 portal protein [Citrobacter freundii]EKY0311755.1 portal protein [Citrobacter freundii]EKY0667476.1 portal protein [Citrobacter freundii]MBA7991188.1 portal protein [Citrobacter freundii]MBJ9088768.1 portal protein [Citrobacter freundii]